MALDTRTNVDKEINEGILRTYLGIDDPTGIDFGTYKTLLREKIAAARMGGSDMDSSDISYLTNEFLRIKNIEPAKTKKIDINKFVKKAEEKKKKTKLSAQKLFEAAKDTAESSAPKAGKVSNQKLLPPSRITPIPEDEVDDFYGQDLDDLINEIRNDKEETQAVIDDLKKESEEQKKILNMLTPSFSSIEENLESILAINKDQTKTKEKNLKQGDKEEQVISRKNREAQLESKAPKLKSVDKLEDTTKKVGGFMDMLLTFLGNILAGGAITGLKNILENPLRIFNPVITFVNGFIESFNNLLTDIFEVFRSPVQGLIDGLNSAGSFLLEQFNKALDFFNMEPMEGFGPIPDFDVFQIPKIKLIDPPEIPDDTDTKPKLQGLSGGGETEISPATTPSQGEEIIINSVDVSSRDATSKDVSSPTNNTKPFSGEVKQTSGVASKGMGVDNRQVAVQGGEVVFSNPAVKFWGAPTLLTMNKIGGGTNRPQTREGMVTAAGGGLLDFIGSGEGGYNSMNQGTQGGKIVGSTHNAKSKINKNLTEMTIGEIMERQTYLMDRNNPQVSDYGIFAAGKYQLIPDTMPIAVKAAGLSASDMFSPTNQEKLGRALIYDKRPAVGNFIEGRSNDIDAAMHALSNEFASMPDPTTGNSKYGAGNRALHTVQEVREVLLKERTMVASGGASIPNLALSIPATKDSSQPESSAPAAQLSSSPASSKSTPPPPPVKKKPLAVIAAASGGSGAGSQSSSGSNAGQTRVDGFSPIDLNNPELIVIKSIYNVVG